MHLERLLSVLSEASLRRQALGITQVLSSLASTAGDAVSGCSPSHLITIRSAWKHSGASHDAMQLQNRRCFSTMRPPGGMQATPGTLAHSVAIRTGGTTDVRLETGTMALQADGACLASSGSTHVLATTVCNSATAVEDDEGMLPLQVWHLLGSPQWVHPICAGRCNVMPSCSLRLCKHCIFCAAMSACF